MESLKENEAYQLVDKLARKKVEEDFEGKDKCKGGSGKVQGLGGSKRVLSSKGSRLRPELQPYT